VWHVNLVTDVTIITSRVVRERRNKNRFALDTISLSIREPIIKIDPRTVDSWSVRTCNGIMFGGMRVFRSCLSAISFFSPEETF